MLRLLSVRVVVVLISLVAVEARALCEFSALNEVTNPRALIGAEAEIAGLRGTVFAATNDSVTLIDDDGFARTIALRGNRLRATGAGNSLVANRAAYDKALAEARRQLSASHPADAWEAVVDHHGEPSVKPKSLVGSVIAGITSSGGTFVTPYQGRVRRILETFSDMPGRRASYYEAEIIDDAGHVRTVNLSGAGDSFYVKKDSKIDMPKLATSVAGGTDVSSVEAIKREVRYPDGLVGRDIRVVTYDDNGKPYEYAGTVARYHVGENGMKLFAGPVSFANGVPTSYTLEIITPSGLVFPLPVTAGKSQIQLGALPEFATKNGVPTGEIKALNDREVGALTDKASAAIERAGTYRPAQDFAKGQQVAGVTITDGHRVKAISGTVTRAFTITDAKLGAPGQYALVQTETGMEIVSLAGGKFYSKN